VPPQRFFAWCRSFYEKTYIRLQNFFYPGIYPLLSGYNTLFCFAGAGIPNQGMKNSINNIK